MEQTWFEKSNKRKFQKMTALTKRIHIKKDLLLSKPTMKNIIPSWIVVLKRHSKSPPKAWSRGRIIAWEEVELSITPRAIGMTPLLLTMNIAVLASKEEPRVQPILCPETIKTPSTALMPPLALLLSQWASKTSLLAQAPTWTALLARSLATSGQLLLVIISHSTRSPIRRYRRCKKKWTLCTLGKLLKMVLTWIGDLIRKRRQVWVSSSILSVAWEARQWLEVVQTMATNCDE